MRAGEHDLDLVAHVAHVQQQAAHAVARLELLTGDLLRPGHERLGPVDRDDQRPALVTLHRAGRDLADALAELVEHALALVVAETLDHHLLERLGRDAPQVLRRDLQGLAVPAQVDLPVDRVERAAELLGVEGVVELARRAHHRLLEVLDQHALLDAPVARDAVEDPHHFLGVHPCTVLSVVPALSRCETEM